MDAGAGGGRDVGAEYSPQAARAASIFGGSSVLTPQSSREPPCASPAVLTNVQRIMLRAQQRFNEEEEAREVIDLTAGSSSRDSSKFGLGIDTIIIDDDDDDDDLPDEIDFKILGVSPKKPRLASPAHMRPSQGALSDLSDDRTPKRPRRLNDDLLDDSPSKDDLLDFDIPKPPESTIATGRAKRSTARAAPYLFKVSLDRPSDTRQTMLDAKGSAAVKANIIKVEEYKRGGRRGDSSDLISKMLRRKRQDNKKGVGSDALAAALERIERGKRFLEEDQSSNSESGSENGSSSASEEDDYDEDDEEIRSSPPSSPLRHRAITSPSLRKSALETVASALEGINEEEGQSAVDILKQDQTEARLYARNDGDEGAAERSFWRLDSVRLPRQDPCKRLFDARGIFKLVERYQQSDDATALAIFLSSPAFANALQSLDANNSSSEAFIASLIDFLVDAALLARDEDLALSAVNALRCFVGRHGDSTMSEIVEALRDALYKLGAQGAVLAGNDEGDDQSPLLLPNPNQVATTDSGKVYKLTKTDRLHRVSRFVDVCAGLASALSHASYNATSTCRPLFFCLLSLSVDPAQATLQPEIAEVLRVLIDCILSQSSSLQLDKLLCERIVHILQDKKGTTKLAYLHALPSHSLRTRALVRNVARLLVLAPMESGDANRTYNIVVPTFTTVRDILAKQNESINPLWVPRGRRVDYIQLEASVGVFMHCFVDLMLQLSSGTKQAGRTHELQSRALARYQALGIEELVRVREGSPASLRPAQSPPFVHGEPSDENRNHATQGAFTLHPDSKKARQVYEISVQLQNLSRRIHDDSHGGGAAGFGTSDVQTRAKDALQRAAFMLSYHLQQHSWKFSGEGDEIKKEAAQMTMDSFIRQPSSVPSSRYVTPQ